MSIPVSLVQALADFSRRPRVLVASDFDGVLAPFADDPMQVRPVDGAVPALVDLATAGDAVALVSGRDLSALRAVSGIQPAHGIDLIGSHGGESTRPLALGGVMDRAASARLRQVTEALHGVQADHPGTRLEHKPAGVTLHTRGLPGDVAESAAADALAVSRRIAGVHPLRGKDVVEIGVLAVSKGQAVTALAADVRAQAVLYLGDDVTDETVFAALPVTDGHVTVKVGRGETLAAHRIPGPDDVLEVLHAVARLRRPT